MGERAAAEKTSSWKLFCEDVFSKMELLSVKQVPEGQATLHVSNKISRL
jgi:hypothetical protein